MLRSNWKFVTGTNMYMSLLSKDMYRDHIACLWEVIRNGLCACMPSEAKWDPGVTYVELWLTRDHPLSPKSWAIVCMDKGSGLTDPKLKRFLNFGGDDPAAVGAHAGAAHKQIGRLAYFAQNRSVVEENKTDSGFFMITRTCSTGPADLIDVTPQKIRDDAVAPRQIHTDASEMWRFKNIKGAFTVVVIPNAVFDNIDEIRNGLRWYLPRRKSQAVKLMVDGKLLEAPPLAGKSVVSGEIEAYMEKVESTIIGKTGIWLTDAETGLRCAFCPDMGGYVPDPLARPDVNGDIIIKDLLRQQHPSRNGLNPNFLKSERWKKQLFPVLLAKVAPFAKELIGEALYINTSEPHGKRLQGFVDLINGTWGVPKIHGGDILRNTPGPVRRRPSRLNPPTGIGGGKPPATGDHEPLKDGLTGEEGGPRKRGMAIKIRDKEYYVQNMDGMDPRLFAEIGGRGNNTLFTNPEYAIPGLSKTAMDEHCLLHILHAVARQIHPHNTVEALIMGEELRREILSAQKKQ